ncbi:hypothetical protein HDU96_007532 [Phlyctochytrium bullatum]|nr:hypothetical protein HDU96_007532 [Phlyctochytrium bullatum]
MSRKPDFHLVAGSYERLLYGIDGLLETSANQADVEEGDINSAELKPSYIYPAHISSIKCVAVQPGGRFLATGSTDEHVRLYDLQLRKEIGSLMHHSGSITDILFFERTHLLTASEDGTVAIIRTKDWEQLDTLSGHKGPVRSMAIHPSGRLLLTISDDGYLKLWDITKSNCCAYTHKLDDGPAEQVVWSSTGDYYAILRNRGLKIHVFRTSDASLSSKFEGKRRRNAITVARLQGDKEVLIAGGEDGKVEMWDFETSNLLARWDSGHKARIKDLDALTLRTPSAVNVLATCSTLGGIFVWDLDAVADHCKADPDSEKDGPTTLGVYDAKCRLTCLALACSTSRKTKTSDAEGADENESEDDYEVQTITTTTPSTTAATTTASSSRHGRVTISFEDDAKEEAGPSKKSGKSNVAAAKAIGKRAGQKVTPKASGKNVTLKNRLKALQSKKSGIKKSRDKKK